MRSENRYHWGLTTKEKIILAPIFAVWGVCHGIKSGVKKIGKIFKKKEK